MTVKTDNTDKLSDMLKSGNAEVDVLAEAMKEVAEEEAAKKKEAAKELLRKAKSLEAQMNQSEKNFLAEKKRFDKELGKVLNRLKNMAAGRPIDEGEEAEKAE